MAPNQTDDFGYTLRTKANSHFSHNFIHLEVLVTECFLQARKGFFATRFDAFHWLTLEIGTTAAMFGSSSWHRYSWKASRHRSKPWIRLIQQREGWCSHKNQLTSLVSYVNVMLHKSKNDNMPWNVKFRVPYRPFPGIEKEGYCVLPLNHRELMLVFQAPPP